MQWRNKWSTLIYLLVPVMFMLILFAIQKASSGPHGTFAFFFFRLASEFVVPGPVVNSKMEVC